MSTLTLCEPLTPLEYRLDLKVDHKAPNFKGQLTAVVRQRQDKPFTCFKFHGKNLIVTKATLEGQPLKVSYDGDAQTVCFTCQEPISIDTEDRISELSVSYIGKVNNIKTHQEPTTGLFKTNFMNEKTGVSDSFLLATHTQPVFARTIFPCFDEPASKCNYALTLTTHERFKVVANAAVVKRTVSGGSQTIQFAKTPLMNTSYFGFCIGDLEFLKTDVQLQNKKIPLQLFAPKSIANAAYGFDSIAELLPLVERRFGADFPMEKLDVVLLPFLSDLAMENWGLITFEMNHLLLSPQSLSNSSVTQQLRQLIAHELCHQWMGNYISFDSWDHLWFNEAFSTWFACDLLDEHDGTNYWYSDPYIAQMETVMTTDAKAATQSIFQQAIIDTRKLSATTDAFNAHIYYKGVSILRSMYESIGKEPFNRAITNILSDKQYHETPVKPIDLFSRMGQILRSENIANFYTSWTRTPGVPVVSVRTDNKHTILEQHRFLIEKEDTEDVPYHVPIFGTLPSGKDDCKNGLLTDRTLSLPESELLINGAYRGYFRVSYETEECYTAINVALKKKLLSDINIFKIFLDIKAFIGTDFQKKCHIDGLISLLKTIASECELEEYMFRGLSIGLDLLQKVENAVRTYGGKLDETLVYSIYLPLWDKLCWSNLNVSAYNLQVMSKVMFGLKEHESTFNVANQIMKKITSGPNNSVPLELCGSVFATISYHQTSVKQWKKLHELFKSAKGVASHVQGGTASQLQDLALENLGFNTNEELINKTLNFISSNIACPNVENALFGLNYNFSKISNGNIPQTVRDICWDWFKLNFDLWARKAITQASETNLKLRQTLLHISYVIFQMWMDKPEVIDQFVTRKSAVYGEKVGIDVLWRSVKENEATVMNIYRCVLGF